MIDATSTALFSANIDPVFGRGALAGMGALAAPGKNMSEAQIDKTAKDFESMFISQMLEPMFGDSVGDASFGNGESNDVYKSMMMDAYGKEIVKAGGIGIADYVKKELLKLQEAN